MAVKKVTGSVKLQIAAGKATPAPPVGTVLGPTGINIVEFCKTYNEKTAAQTGQIIPAQLTIYEDRSFTFILKTPPAAILIKKELGLEKGSAAPNRDKVSKVTKAQLRKIAELKMPDLNAGDVDAAMRIIAGTARSMGVEVVD